MRAFAFAALAFGVGLASPAYADFTAFSSFDFEPLSPGFVTPVQLQSVSPVPSQSPITSLGYSIAFNGTASNQGVVKSASFTFCAIPVAGESGTDPTFLTGDYQSSDTSDPAQAGNYFSTGAVGAIAITFSLDQSALTLLWGSIDTNNVLDFYEGTTFLGSVFGQQIQAITPAFVSNGFQGVGGSAYVTLNPPGPFNTVVARSGVLSFEFAGLAASCPRSIRRNRARSSCSRAAFSVWDSRDTGEDTPLRRGRAPCKAVL